MLCNAGESKSIFVDVQDPCLQPRVLQIHFNLHSKQVNKLHSVVFLMMIIAINLSQLQWIMHNTYCICFPKV